MTDVFSNYGHKATSAAPDRLVGVVKTRAESRRVYTDIIAELSACEDLDMLDAYLTTIAHELAQFRAELDFLWEGDGHDFLGLETEIYQARERLESIPVQPEYQGFGPL